MARYHLSEQALEDLDRLYEYGVLNFGLDQADAYFDGLIDRFMDIAGFPERYPAVDKIREGYRRSVFGVHSIYYRMSAERVEIIRILGREDTTQAF